MFKREFAGCNITKDTKGCTGDDLNSIKLHVDKIEYQQLQALNMLAHEMPYYFLMKRSGTGMSIIFKPNK